jgi:thiosulfate dehydrogenase [quinone] large subunit
VSSPDRGGARGTEPDRASTASRAISKAGGHAAPTVGRYLEALRRELQKPGAYLLPLRFFIAIGWLRSAVEKVTGDGWFDGRAITMFLDQQVESGAVVFSAYQALIDSLLRPGAVVVGWLVTILEFAVGIAILTGMFTNLALLIGIGLNVSMMLAGRINPSAFYIVIQIALFAGGTGAVLGFDGRRTGGTRPIALRARSELDPATEPDRIWIATLGGVFASLSIYALLNTSDFSPSAVTDPAAVLSVVMAVAALSMLITWFRFDASTQRAISGRRSSGETQKMS